MGHNVSREKQRQLERNRLAAELAAHLVPGWTVDPLRLRVVATASILGHRQRRQSVLLRCARPDCRRRVEMDLAGAIDAGHADRSPEQVAGLLRCGHWAGCGLATVSATYPDGVPLVGLLDEPKALVAVTCRHCAARVVLPPARVIERLKAAGTGDGSTGVLAVGRVVRGPCRKCRRRQFDSELLRC